MTARTNKKIPLSFEVFHDDKKPIIFFTIILKFILHGLEIVKCIRCSQFNHCYLELRYGEKERRIDQNVPDIIFIPLKINRKSQLKKKSKSVQITKLETKKQSAMDHKNIAMDLEPPSTRKLESNLILHIRFQ